MALKKPFEPLSLFSMSSMTDVIFLLLIFFMVTTTLISPSAVEVDLPSSEAQVSARPVTEVYLDSLYRIMIVEDRTDTADVTRFSPREVELAELGQRLAAIHELDSARTIALYADQGVKYGKVVEILDVAAKQKLKMVLATRPPIKDK